MAKFFNPRKYEKYLTDVELASKRRIEAKFCAWFDNLKPTKRFIFLKFINIVFPILVKIVDGEFQKKVN